MAHISCCHISQEGSWSSLEALLPFVSSERQERILKQKNLHHAWQLWISERLVQNQMEKVLNQPCTFFTDQYGKPRIKDQDIHFNCSHSGDWVVCVFGDKEVGIDIEEIKPIDIQLFTDCFPEIKNLNDHSFFSLWTIKEAYLKATGFGLYKELSSVCVPEEQLESNLITPIDLQQTACSFSCKRINFIKGYALTICGIKTELNSIEIYEENVESLTPH